MKILFKSGSTMMGGLEKVQIEYINFLLSSGHDVKIIIENDNGEENVLEKYILGKVEYIKDFNYISKIKNLREIRNKNIITKINYNYNLLKERIYANYKFLEIYKEYSPDIVIDFDASLIKIVKKLIKSKNLVWIHSSITNWKKKKNKIERFITRLESYDKIICICKEMREELLDINHKLFEKIEVLYNPIDFQKIRELSEKNIESQEEMTKEKFLLMVARLDIIPKDFGTLFLAFDKAKEKGYKGKLYLIGDGPDREKVEERIEKSKFKEDIFILGRKINPYNWMKKADKIILSSRYEGFAMVLLEGLCLNKEVISSNCKTGPKEILAENRGEIFEIGDYQKLSEYILQKNKIRDINLDEFKSEKTFKKLNELIEELICLKN